MVVLQASQMEQVIVMLSVMLYVFLGTLSTRIS